MPKKTKKEKILAEYRKKLKLLNTNNKVFNSNRNIKDKKEETSINQSRKIIKAKENHDTSFHFLNDLKKSLLISLFLIIIEIILYFVKLI